VPQASIKMIEERLHDSKQEMEGFRDELLGLLIEFENAGLGGGEADDPAAGPLRRDVWQCVQALDDLLRSTRKVTGGIEALPDLTRNDEETRQRLYNLVVKERFSPYLLSDPGEIFLPVRGPEEAGLEVYFQHGRWWATWLEGEKRQLLLLTAREDDPGSLFYVEI
jgi:hypothetical protein